MNTPVLIMCVPPCGWHSSLGNMQFFYVKPSDFVHTSSLSSPCYVQSRKQAHCIETLRRHNTHTCACTNMYRHMIRFIYIAYLTMYNDPAHIIKNTYWLRSCSPLACRPTSGEHCGITPVPDINRTTRIVFCNA